MMTYADAILIMLQLATAVASIVVAAWVGHYVVQSQKDQREHNRLSVRPMVHSWFNESQKDGEISLMIENNGVGPAIIDKLSIVDLTDGSECPIDRRAVTDLVMARLGKRHQWNVRTTIKAPASPYTLATGTSLELVRIVIEDDVEEFFFHYSNNVRRDLSLLITYRSIYGEEFTHWDP